MKHLLIAILTICFFSRSSAQETQHLLYDRSNGYLIYTIQYEQIKGSPFLFDDWKKAAIISNKGYAFNNVELKFDIYINRFLLNKNDTAYLVNENTKSIKLFPNDNDTIAKMIFENGFVSPGNFTEKNYLQILAKGALTLLKYYHADMIEYTEYNDPVKYKRFVPVKDYFILRNETTEKIGLNKKKFNEILLSKKDAVDSFIKQKNLSGKDEKDWITAINYFNSIQ
ncbi:MAG TPA: hypothetical protein VHP12_08985 [Chitinophagaceae bacterium]|nr:hypothetical protein [Chitinophagaceae bacterium]